MVPSHTSANSSFEHRSSSSLVWKETIKRAYLEHYPISQAVRAHLDAKTKHRGAIHCGSGEP